MRYKGSDVTLTIGGEEMKVKDFSYAQTEHTPLPPMHSLQTMIDITLTVANPGLRFRVTYDKGYPVNKFVDDFIRNFSLKHYVGPIKALYAHFDVYGIMQCKLVMAVGNREPPHENIEIQFGGGMNTAMMDRMTPKQQMESCSRWLHNYLRDATLHELDECIYIDGKRLFDPHPKETIEQIMFEESVKTGIR